MLLLGLALGRDIAPVMGWQGADWLEREGRAQEEQTGRMIRRLRLKKGMHVADLGCGTGFHARRMKQKVGHTGRVVCVDLQPEMLERAREEAEAEGVVLDYVLGAHDTIPLRDASLDRILLVDVFHELQEPEVMLAELRRVLAPEGQITVVEFRLEGDSAAHVYTVHRMADEQVQAEFEAAGFALQKQWHDLPSQHLMRFRAANPEPPG